MTQTADKIRQLAAEGHSAPEIATRLRVGVRWVYSCAKMHGIDLPAHKWPETVTADAIASHTGTDAELARSLGVTRSAVAQARKRYGVSYRKPLSKTVVKAIVSEAQRRNCTIAQVLGDLNVWADGAEKEVES